MAHVATMCKPGIQSYSHFAGSLSLPDITTLTVHSLILDLKLIFRKDSNRQVCRVFLKANTERQGCPANVGDLDIYKISKIEAFFHMPKKIAKSEKKLDPVPHPMSYEN